MAQILVDTCIFIDLFRGNQDLQNELFHIQPVINTIVYMELLQGAKNKQNLKQIDRFLKQFELFHINEPISIKALRLIEHFSKSHGLGIPDGLIAATRF